MKCDFRAVQKSALCRSRRELSNDYLLANLASIQPRTSPVKFAASRKCPEVNAAAAAPAAHATRRPGSSASGSLQEGRFNGEHRVCRLAERFNENGGGGIGEIRSKIRWIINLKSKFLLI